MLDYRAGHENERLSKLRWFSSAIPPQSECLSRSRLVRIEVLRSSVFHPASRNQFSFKTTPRMSK